MDKEKLRLVLNSIIANLLDKDKSEKFILECIKITNEDNDNLFSIEQLREIISEQIKVKQDLENLGNKKDKKKKEEFEYKSLIESEEYLCEQVYNKKEKKSQFCVYYLKDGRIEYKDRIDNIKPIEDEEVLNEQIGLPDQVEEYGTDEELDKEIDSFISEWLDIPDKIKRLAIYNIRMSWVFQKFHTLNYLRALGDTGSGKSRFLDVLGYLHYKPIATSGALTSAVLFRVINKWKGTLIIDEADMNNDDEKNDVIKIINQGYEKGKTVMRCDIEDKKKLEFFDVYCPKVIATRKLFGDQATESRCITNVMEMTNRKNIPPNLNKRFWEKVSTLRNKLLMWRFRNYNKINIDAAENIDLGIEIEPRLKQVTTSLISLFHDNPKEMENFKEFLLGYQKELVESRSNSLEGVTVKAICELTIDHVNITATNIINKGDLRDSKGNIWKPRRLNSVIKVLKLDKTKPAWDAENKKTIKVYDISMEYLLSMAKKYLSDEDLLHQLTHLTIHTEQVKNNNNNESEQTSLLGNEGKVGMLVSEESTLMSYQDQAINIAEEKFFKDEKS